ncbi:Peptidase family M1 [Fodinibius roseus]|uniref:Peptidase family M1 n=1 Tax=Fodinibius roseus TaxID=1194090 RepID=A0A1M5FYI7_9BACT|nr:hypothetical protein [Fodinibius roseus]SHF96474.1 Peptidase family M1 [Fodinibius roseus]
MSRTHSLSERFRRSLLSLALLGGVLLGLAPELDAQSFDHEPYPKLDFNFTELELELGVQPQNLRLDAAATYQIEANVSGADTVILYASHMDISSASVDGEAAEFRMHNDSLLIPLAEAAEKGQAYEVRIRYSTDPRFGLLKNSNNTVWTSLLPRSQRHWVPVIDNPHVTLKTTFNISVPAGYTVWATGRKTGEEAVTEEVVQYQFASEAEVPASDLAFAIGNFESQSTTYGIKGINLAVEQELAGEVDLQQLLQQAYDGLGSVEKQMQSEFPYDRLNVVVLEDHGWETKSWGGSTVFLYQNRGDLQQQLLRGIIAQWIGSKQRAAQWSQADAIMVYQTLLQQSLTGETQELEVKDQPQPSRKSIYELFGPQRWNAWQQRWSRWEEQSKDWIIKETHPEMIKQLSPVISWRDYAGLWYRSSGQPMFDVSEVLNTERADTSSSGAADQAKADSVRYRVSYQLDETGEQLALGFKSVQGVYDELKMLRLHKIYGEGSETEDISFTGMTDAISVGVSPDIRTAWLEIPGQLKLKIEEHKPVPFLLYELRNAESLDQRARAAKNLGAHTDNPDLQLAITDALESGVDPEVRAALLTSLADITRGAAGTEQLFLDALRHESRVVQRAGLKALRNYPENPDIRSTVQQLTVNTDRLPVFKQGIATLSAIASAEQLEGFIADIVRRDTVGHRSVAAIRQLADEGQTGILGEAERFLDEEYDYGVRQAALNLLIEYEDTSGIWEERSRELLAESADPRIRYMVVRGLLNNRNPEIISFLEEYMEDEYDARVYHAIRQGIGE